MGFLQRGRALGFRTINLGPDTPLSALQEAAQHHRPRLIWMSASSPVNPSRARAVSRWLGSLDGTTVVVGGRHGESLAGDESSIRHLDTMSALSVLAAQLATPAQSAAASR